MKVTAPFDVYVPALADTANEGHVSAGESVEVPAEVGKSLVAQGWGSATNNTDAAKAAKAKD